MHFHKSGFSELVDTVVGKIESVTYGNLPPTDNFNSPPLTRDRPPRHERTRRARANLPSHSSRRPMPGRSDGENYAKESGSVAEKLWSSGNADTVHVLYSISQENEMSASSCGIKRRPHRRGEGKRVAESVEVRRR
jgi:hypothetical protein